MLDATRANVITAAINAEFALIGYTGDAKLPRTTRSDVKNTEPVAWEVLVSKHLERIAKARTAKAVKAAVKAGVMFDPETDPRVPGTEALVYAGEIVEIAVSVTTPATRLDADELQAALVRAGMKLPLVELLFKRCTHDNRAPHKFTSSLRTK